MQMFSVILLFLVSSVDQVICHGYVVFTYSNDVAIRNQSFTFTCATRGFLAASYLVTVFARGRDGRFYKRAIFHQTRDGVCYLSEQWPPRNSISCGLGTNDRLSLWKLYHYRIVRVGSMTSFPDDTLWKCQAHMQHSRILRLALAESYGTRTILTASDSILVPNSPVELSCSVTKDNMLSSLISFYRNVEGSSTFPQHFASFIQGDKECQGLDKKPEFEMRCGEGTRESNPRVRKYHLVISREKSGDTTWRCGTDTGEMSNKVLLTSVM